jgi:hypothetical protein
MLSEPLAVVARLGDVLDQLNVRYVVGGSLASSVYGIPRATQDADLVADLKLHHAEAFAVLLGDDFYVDVDMIADAIERRASFNVVHLASMFKADIFIPKDDSWSVEELLRAREEKFNVSEQIVTIRFASPEDTLLHKLVWYKMGDEISDRQWSDVLGILKVQGQDLDYHYLWHWAELLDVPALLASAIEESS